MQARIWEEEKHQSPYIYCQDASTLSIQAFFVNWISTSKIPVQISFCCKDWTIKWFTWCRFGVHFSAHFITLSHPKACRASIPFATTSLTFLKKKMKAHKPQRDVLSQHDAFGSSTMAGKTNLGIITAGSGFIFSKGESFSRRATSKTKLHHNAFFLL